MNIIIGGITGLFKTITISDRQPSNELRVRMNLPADDMCVHEFNCALSDSILLQGNLYVFNTAVCFHSLFNKRTVVGDQDTLIVIPYRQIVSIKKKSVLLISNSIQINTINGSYFFTSFIRRNHTFGILQDYTTAYLNLLPNHQQLPELTSNNIQKQLNAISDEQLWLAYAIKSIENQQNQQQQQDEQNRRRDNQNQNNNSNPSIQPQQQQLAQQYQLPQQQQQQQIESNLYVDSVIENQPALPNGVNNNNNIRNSIPSMNNNSNNINSFPNQNQEGLVQPQQLQEQQQLGQQLYSNLSEQYNKIQQQNNHQGYFQQLDRISERTNEQSKHELESADYAYALQLQNQQQNHYDNQNGKNDIDNEDDEDNDQQQQQKMAPLEMQKSCIKDFNDYSAIYKPLFEERQNQAFAMVLNDYNTTDTREIVIPSMSAREVFCIFFSNQIFERNGKTYNSFVEYYVLEHLHAQKLTVSEIQPPPPEVFQSVYSNNYSELLNAQLTSDRILSFVHPIPNASMFLPKSLNCTMHEKIFWSSPQSFMLARILNLKGAPVVGCFEPRIIFMISERDNDVVLKSGFKIHFKSNSIFKSMIEKSAIEECDKNWNEIKNLIVNISQEHREKRDANKLINSRINPGFEKPYDLKNFDVHDDIPNENGEEEERKEDLHKIQQGKGDNNNGRQQWNQNGNIQQINKNSNDANNTTKTLSKQNGKLELKQVPDNLSPDQRVVYEQDIQRVAARASNEACIIF